MKKLMIKGSLYYYPGSAGYKKYRAEALLRILMLLLVCFGIIHNELSAQSEGDFYTETINNHSLEKNLRDDYSVDGTGNDSDSYKLQQAINDVASSGGGRVFMPEGTYRLSGVVLKSNVHILIEANSVIVPYIPSSTAKVHLFSLGKSNSKVKNVSIRGVGGRYVVNFARHDPGMTLFNCGNLDNFLLADFLVNDRFTTYSAIGMGPASFIEGQVTWPRNGVVKNGTVLDAHYGYGLTQTQAASNVLFRNIHCTGGATLRIETGWTRMNDYQIGGVDRIYGRNVSCTDGNCAVMISPHAMHNGSVNIDSAICESCVAAVKIGGGFISNKYTNPDLTVGTFSEVIVKNVDATFGIKARLKSQELIYIPQYRQKFLTNISEDGGKSRIGPSIGAIKYNPDEYEENVEVSNVFARGFLCQPDLVRETDEQPSLSCKVLDTIVQTIETMVEISESEYHDRIGIANIHSESIISSDTIYYKVGYIVKTTDSTISTIDSTVTRISGQVTTIDTIVRTTDTYKYHVDPPENNIDTLYFNMDTTIIQTFSSDDVISYSDTVFNYSDTLFTVIDTTVTVSDTTIYYTSAELSKEVGDLPARIYPSPASSVAFLEILGEPAPDAYVSFFNTSGELVLRRQIRSRLTEIPVSSLDPGLYLCRYSSSSKSYSLKPIAVL